MIYVNARVRQFVLVVAVVLAGGLLLVLPKSINTGHAAHSPLPTLTVVCLPMLGGDLSLTDAGYVLDGSGGATLHLGLQNQDVVELTRISFSAQGWDPVAPSHGAVVSLSLIHISLDDRLPARKQRTTHSAEPDARFRRGHLAGA